jgi:hypothetical protein
MHHWWSATMRATVVAAAVIPAAVGRTATVEATSTAAVKTTATTAVSTGMLSKDGRRSAQSYGSDSCEKSLQQGGFPHFDAST